MTTSIFTFIADYKKGNNPNISFEIHSSGEFLGEIGIRPFKTFGPDGKTIALEAWVFDTGAIETITITIIHPTMNQQNRDWLSVDGVLFDVEIGKTFTIKTTTFIVEGQILNFEFENNHFLSLEIEFKAWLFTTSYEDLSSVCVTNLVGMCPMECVISHGFWVAPYWLPFIGGRIFKTIAKTGKLEAHETGYGWIFFHPGLPKGYVRAVALQYETSFRNLYPQGLYLFKKVSIEEG